MLSNWTYLLYYEKKKKTAFQDELERVLLLVSLYLHTVVKGHKIISTNVLFTKISAVFYRSLICTVTYYTQGKCKVLSKNMLILSAVV